MHRARSRHDHAQALLDAPAPSTLEDRRPLRAGRGRCWTLPVAIALMALTLAACTGSTSEPAAPTTTPVPTTVRITPPPTRPPPLDASVIRVAVFGDSVALGTGVGLSRWMNGPEHNDMFPTDGGAPGVVGVNGFTEFGCGLLGAGTIRFRDNEEERDEVCEQWREQWSIALKRSEPDIALVQFGQWEVVDRRLPGDDRFRALGDEVLDDELRARVLEATTLLNEHGAIALWVLAPRIDVGTEDGVRPERPYAESEPSRMDRYNEIVREVAERPDVRAAVIDLPEFLRSMDGGEMDVTLRPDLVHFHVDTFEVRVAAWLGSTALATHDRIVSTGAAP